MRILRLTNSDDFNGRIAEESRTPAVAQRTFEQATGLSAETTTRVIWPDDELPTLIDRWLDRFEPDLVMLAISSFWFTYESVPLRIQQRLGPRVGRPLAQAGIRAAAKPWLAESALFRRGREMAHRVIGGVAYFTPEYIMGLMEACTRTITRRESMALLLRGPHSAFNAPGSRAGYELAERRRTQVVGGLRRISEKFEVELMGRDVAPRFETEIFMKDHVHLNDFGHRQRGEEEGRGMVRAWRRLHPEE